MVLFKKFKVSILAQLVCSRLLVFIGNPRWCCSVQIGILDELECVLQSVSSKRNTTESMVNICKLFIQAQILFKKTLNWQAFLFFPDFLPWFFRHAARNQFWYKIKGFLLGPLWTQILSLACSAFVRISNFH